MNYFTLLNRCRNFRDPFKGKLVGNNLRLRLDKSGTIQVIHHNTVIVEWFPDDSVRLNNGGWYSVTTKANMNCYLPDGYYIHQKKHVWYLSGPYCVKEYKNYMVIGPTAIELAKAI